MPPVMLRAMMLALLCLVAACANRPATVRQGYGGQSFGSRYYPPPGPPEDPWGPYITEAAARFKVPERWIRRVMRQESGGQEGVVSSAGAMGLMQVMPATYEGLRQRYGLGDDPFDPHNNLLAGTAYIREMYDRYGSPAFLAAYNAGPNRLEDYLAGNSALPDETVNYLAAIAPNLGDEVPVSGPLAVFAQRGNGNYPPTVRTVAARADGCDPDAAYDPDRVCAPSAPVAQAAAAPPATVVSAMPAGGGCEDSAYDPTRPCAPAAPLEPPATVASVVPASGDCDPDAAYDPTRPCMAQPQPRFQLVAASLPAPAIVREAADGQWAIQVGAFADPALARSVADRARLALGDLLRSAKIALPTTTPFGGTVLYRARLVALSPAQAAQSCARLNALQLACMVVPPANGS